MEPDSGYEIACGLALPQEAGISSLRSAKGAKYDSQGQAPSSARRVAPGKPVNKYEALKERNN